LKKLGTFVLSLAEMELTVAQSAMEAASRKSSDFSFEGFESVFHIANSAAKQFQRRSVETETLKKWAQIGKSFDGKWFLSQWCTAYLPRFRHFADLPCAVVLVTFRSCCREACSQVCEITSEWLATRPPSTECPFVIFIPVKYLLDLGGCFAVAWQAFVKNV